jgi:hypothetical protein
MSHVTVQCDGPEGPDAPGSGPMPGSTEPPEAGVTWTMTVTGISLIVIKSQNTTQIMTLTRKDAAATAAT